MSAPTKPPLKHERIARALEAEIRAGTPATGEQLPSESELVRRFGASRNTVRTALAALTDRGLVATRAGVGSFVVWSGDEEGRDLTWAHAIQRKGSATRLRLLAIEVIPARTAAEFPGTALRSWDSDDLLSIERVRTVIGDRVIAYEHSLIPIRGSDVLRATPRTGLRDGSVMRTLQQAGVIPVEGAQTIGCRRLVTTEARVFGKEEGAPVLESVCVSRTASGGLAERMVGLFDPDYYQLQLAYRQRTER